ncbi:TonB-dependent receptor [Christiangramia salexigens]|uniref:TonB-dependent receptor n=1 Tax=Christiangramia salexigens TaxID=1913577 RepID=A0A1L3J8M6_9FLAO|nr:TonB-dependent receptor [Christiangramia salexigens]
MAISSISQINAQNLEGEVSAANGKSLENVKIEELASGRIIFSGVNGKFQFSDLQFPAKLRFSLLGYASKVAVFQNYKEALEIIMEEEAAQLSEIILRGSNIPKSIRRTPSAVGLISKDDLKKSDNFNLVQNFNFVPGVFVSQGALNTNKINIRGIGSRSQYSTNRIKAYINGIPLTTAEGELTLDDFDPELLERIEIYKGPVSSSFGAGLGGSINLYTPRLRNEQKSVVGTYTYGSFDSRKYRVNLNYVKDSLDLSIAYNNIESEGFRQNGNYDRISMTGTAGYLNKSGNYWSLFFSYSSLKAYIPSSLSETDFKNSPDKAAFTWFQSAGYESYERNVFGVSYDHKFSENFRSETSVFFNSRDAYEPRPFNILDEDMHSVGLRTKFNLNTSVFGKTSELSFGAETMMEWYETSTFQNLYEDFEARESVGGARLSQNFQDRKYLNLFAEINAELSDDLLFEAGLNFNLTGYELEDRFNANENDQSGAYSFEPVLSPRIGLNYEAFTGKNFYASASYGFSTPTVSQTLTPEGNINTDLKTETGVNYEIGFKGNWLKNKLYTELNLYSIQTRNLLVARRVGPDQFVGVNAGKADHKGVEFSSVFKSQLTEMVNINWFLNSNINFYEFDKFVDLGENYSGNELPGIPKYMVSPGIEVLVQDFTARLNYQAFGEMALNDANSKYTDPYELLNLKLNYDIRLSRYFQAGVNFGINNILNEHYAASVVTNAVGFGNSEPRYYYPGNPRNYYGGLQVKYSL